MEEQILHTSSFSGLIKLFCFIKRVFYNIYFYNTNLWITEPLEWWPDKGWHQITSPASHPCRSTSHHSTHASSCSTWSSVTFNWTKITSRKWIINNNNLKSCSRKIKDKIYSIRSSRDPLSILSATHSTNPTTGLEISPIAQDTLLVFRWINTDGKDIGYISLCSTMQEYQEVIVANFLHPQRYWTDIRVHILSQA